MTQQPLAIVIPAYKARFLDQTLASVAAQTRRDFTAYVGDDASPEGLGEICARWQGRFDLRYTRFATNLGRDDLAAQWQRCIALGREPWVWLFADDDLMPPDGVERLLAAIAAEGSRFDLFHFNVEQVDAEGRVRRAEAEFPPLLSAREFARRRLAFELASYAPDYAFARAAFERCGGFVPFPRAWCSDDATWMTLAAASGIRTIDGAKVRWRHSGENISSRHDADADAKTEAQLAFLAWLDRFLLAHPARPGEPADDEVLRAARPWFFQQAKTMDQRFPPARARQVLAAFARLRGASPVAAAASMAWLGLRSAVRRLQRRRSRTR